MKEAIESLKNSVDEMLQFLIEEHGDSTNCKPIRIIYDMKRALKKLEET